MRRYLIVLAAPVALLAAWVWLIDYATRKDAEFDERAWS